MSTAHQTVTVLAPNFGSPIGGFTATFSAGQFEARALVADQKANPITITLRDDPAEQGRLEEWLRHLTNPQIESVRQWVTAAARQLLNPMRIRMQSTQTGCADGNNVTAYKKGHTYELGRDDASLRLARSFVRNGWAVDLNAPPAAPGDGQPAAPQPAASFVDRAVRRVLGERSA